ncbi:MAG: SRPBCC domain-containing protein [Gemmatimonadaceae bacterium]|nr:SRPBCC domain-containing protein [Gemmatimonadaceae bacterium]
MSWTHEHTWTLAAAPDVVFRALTDADALRVWFAEHVAVGSTIGAPFRFWGKHTLSTPDASSATQGITEWVTGQRLSFTWPIDGVRTEVSIALSAHEGNTTLVLHHVVHGDLGVLRARELLDDHWRFVFGNLSAHLAGGSGIVLPDFSNTAPEVRQAVLIDAPRTTVFRALITPELVAQWFGAKAVVIEPHVGGRYELGWTYKVDGRDVIGGPTHILEYVENERLVLDWPDWRGDASVTGQTISFNLESIGDQTRLTFVHAGFSRTTDISDYPFGWVYFLGELLKVAATPHSA